MWKVVLSSLSGQDGTGRGQEGRDIPEYEVVFTKTQRHENVTSLGDVELVWLGWVDGEEKKDEAAEWPMMRGPCVQNPQEQHCLEGSGKPREVVFTT